MFTLPGTSFSLNSSETFSLRDRVLDISGYRFFTPEGLPPATIDCQSSTGFLIKSLTLFDNVNIINARRSSLSPPLLTPAPVGFDVASGAAIKIIDQGVVYASGVAFINNSAPEGYGGAVHAEAETRFTCVDCAFIDNTARVGAAVAAYQSVVMISTSTFLRNIAENEAGAIWMVSAAEVHVEDSLFDQNVVYSMGFDSIGGG